MSTKHIAKAHDHFFRNLIKSNLSPEIGEKIVSTFADYFKEQWKEKGLEEGL